VRLNPNGTLDTTFGPKGSGGKVSVTGGGNEADSMAVLPDGSFVLAGMSIQSSGAGLLALDRFNANGTLDTTFGKSGHGVVAGEVVTSISIARAGTNQHCVRVAVDSSGRIIVTATTAGAIATRDFLVARFNANGSLDTTFGPAHTGVVTTDILGGSVDNARALAIQPDGKIVVGGSSNAVNGPGYLLAMARYNTDGTLDTTFGSGGIVTADAIPNYYHSGAQIFALAIQPDGRIATAGEGGYYTTNSDGSVNYQSPQLVVSMRFNADGSTDTSYGPSGTGAVLTSFGDNSSEVDDVAGAALQPDGGLVVVGNMNTPQQYSALARFVGSAPSPSPVQVGSVAATPNPVAAGSPVTLTAGGVTTSNAGATVTMVAFYAINDAGVAVFLGDAIRNADGTWTLTWTVNLASGQYTLLALAVDSSGSISDPLAINLDVQ
jgi:uncharacterized delta-60 repeat protein